MKRRCVHEFVSVRRMSRTGLPPVERMSNLIFAHKGVTRAALYQLSIRPAVGVPEVFVEFKRGRLAIGRG